MNKFYETLTNLRGDVLFGYRAQVVDDAGALVDIYQDRSGTRFTDSSGNIVNYAEASSDTGMAEFYWAAETGHILQIADSSGELARPPIIGFGDNYVLGNLSGELPTTAIDGLDATLAAKADTTYVDSGLAEKVPTADLASTDPGKGVDLIGEVTDASIPNPVVLRTILTDAQVSRFLSGAGDGDTDPSAVTAETAKFQAIIDQGRSFSVPTPSNTYCVSTLRPVRGQLIEGDGAYNPSPGNYQFTGDGSGPVFALGDGTSGGPRGITLRNLSVTNTGDDCIYLDTSPDFMIDRVLAGAFGGSAIRGILSVRGGIHNSRLTCSGAGETAVDLLGYFNILSMTGNTVSGGSGGRAVRIGLSQGVTIDGLCIEVSQDGLWIASTLDPNDGQCSGVSLKNIYVEQCKTPLVIGKTFTVQGLHAGGIFISNSATSGIADREACIQFGRMRGATMEGIALYPHSTEDLFWIWAEQASPGFENIRIQSPSTNGTYNAAYAWKGAQASSGSVKAAIGQYCDFGFMGGLNRMGSSEPREWISPVIDSAVSVPMTAWLATSGLGAGGRVFGIEVTDYDGGVLTGVRLRLGRTGSFDMADVTDMSTLTFTNGRAAVPFTANAPILTNQDAVFQVDTAGGATGKFRLKIRYRAN